MNPVLLLAAIICSVSGLPALSDERIIGGTQAGEADFPFVVSITENDRHFCGGFIYNHLWIVTAASCVVGKTPNKLKVIAGQLSLVNSEASEQSVPVFSVVIFDQYNSTGQLNDIALLKLGAPGLNLTISDSVKLINYNEVDDTITKGTVVGWGASLDGGFESINLRSGEVTIEKKATGEPCGEYVANTEFRLATMICASNAADAATPSGSPCQYDEGGPLIQVVPDDATGVATVVGIMSKTKTCAIDSPSVYTRVSVYYSWLLSVAGPQPTGVNIDIQELQLQDEKST